MPSVADLMQLSFKKETQFGSAPSGAYQILRITGESLGTSAQSVTSNEFRSDRQSPGSVITQMEGTGDINFELTPTTFDDLMEGALWSSGWGVGGFTGGDLVDIDLEPADGSPHPYPYLDGGTGAKFANWASYAGRWIVIGLGGVGQTPSVGNLGPRKIVQTGDSNNELWLYGQDFSSEQDRELNADVVEWIDNGTTRSSYTFERYFSDQSSGEKYAVHSGQVINTFGVNFAVGEIVTGSLGLIGKPETSVAVSPTNSADPGTYTAATTTNAFNAVNHLEFLSVDDDWTVQGTGFSFTLNNGVRTQSKMGLLSPIDTVGGTVEITGTVSMYNKPEILEKFLALSNSEVSVAISITPGYVYAFDLPRIQFTSGARPASGKNSDIILSMDFTAGIDPTIGKMIQVARYVPA